MALIYLLLALLCSLYAQAQMKVAAPKVGPWH